MAVWLQVDAVNTDKSDSDRWRLFIKLFASLIELQLLYLLIGYPNDIKNLFIYFV